MMDIRTLANYADVPQKIRVCLNRSLLPHLRGKVGMGVESRIIHPHLNPPLPGGGEILLPYIFSFDSRRVLT